MIALLIASRVVYKMNAAYLYAQHCRILLHLKARYRNIGNVSVPYTYFNRKVVVPSLVLLACMPGSLLHA